MKQIIKDWSPVVALVAIFLLLMNLRGCHSKQPTPINLKPEIKAHDSVKQTIRYIEKVKTVEVVKWFKIKEKAQKDTTPCGEEIRFIVQACDTVRIIDSSLIVSLKKLVQIDSVIIFKQGLMLKADSIYIVKLDKKVRRNRRMALFFGAIVAGGVGVKVTSYNSR